VHISHQFTPSYQLTSIKVFSTPSGIFAVTGSVGVSLFLWIIGGILTFCGLSVFLEFGLAIARSGGEKNYLERVYRHPKYVATCVLAAQMLLLGFSSGNSLAFGRYVLFASGSEAPDGWAARGLAIACVTFSVVLHATAPKWGIRLFNVLGVFKVFILLFIVCSGFAALAGHLKIEQPHNFDNAFSLEIGDGYGGGGAYGYCQALLRIIYSYKGWENANYVLGEIRNPKKTLAWSAPLAIGGTTILYVLANVAYFAAIPKSDLAKSEVIVAGLFFRNVFGNNAGARSLPAFVALSNLGNVLAVSFAHSRLNQEFAKEGLLPWSRFWASNKPFNAPATALFLHLPRRMDQRLRHRRPHLPALQQARALGVALAYIPPHLHRVPCREYLPRHRALHPARWRLERRRLSLLRVPRRRRERASPRRGVLAVLDESVAEVRGLQDHKRAV
jgi:amino acid transporter